MLRPIDEPKDALSQPDRPARPWQSVYKRTLGNPVVRLLAAAILAVVALHLYDRHKIKGDQFAQEAGSRAMADSWEGRTITAWQPKGIQELIGAYAKTLDAQTPAATKNVLWLGYSQLHTINQYKPGDHLAPYWLMKYADCGDCIDPLGLSLPNANFQEYYFLTAALADKIPLSRFSAVVVALSFDTLREDGIRDELGPFMDDATRGRLRQTKVGQAMLAEWDARAKSAADDESSGLNGFAQKRIEDRLNHALERIFPLWAERGDMRTMTYIDLYFLRNAVLGIKPNSIRRVIRPRYIRNMQALDALMASMNQAHVPVIAYFAPVRSDMPTLYDPAEYAAWQTDMTQLCARHGAKLLDYETLVPGRDWGRTNGDWIDFMHFRGEGHQILARALLPELQRTFAGEERGHAVQ